MFVHTTHASTHAYNTTHMQHDTQIQTYINTPKHSSSQACDAPSSESFFFLGHVPVLLNTGVFESSSPETPGGTLQTITNVSLPFGTSPVDPAP